MFTVEAVTDKKFKIFHARTSGDFLVNVRSNFRPLKPVWVMVWAAVALDGGQISFALHWWRRESHQPTLFEHIVGKVFPCLTEAFDNNYVFKQDGAQAHTANATKNWCKDDFWGFLVKQLWPPSSPDIIPKDLSVWSVLELAVLTCSHPPKKMDLLKAAIQSAWTKLNKEMVQRSSASVKARLRLMIKAKDGDFENWSVHYVFYTLLKSSVKAFFHLPSGIIFIGVFRLGKFFWNPCAYDSYAKRIVLASP